MSVARAYSGAEGFIATTSRDERRRQKFIDRITGQADAMIGHGVSSFEARGGWQGLFRTTHDADVYEGVAEQLGERKHRAEIEVYRMIGHKYGPSPYENVMVESPEIAYEYDLVMLTSVGGMAVSQEFPTDAEVVARVYPPEQQ